MSEDFNNLLTDSTQKSIEKVLNNSCPGTSIAIEPGKTNGSSMSQKEHVKSEIKRKQIENQFLSDDGLKELQEVFNTTVDIKSIKSIGESDNV